MHVDNNNIYNGGSVVYDKGTPIKTQTILAL